MVVAYRRLTKELSSTFEVNVSLVYNNTVENARIIISGSKPSIAVIASIEQAVQRAQQLESNAHLEFSLSRSRTSRFGRGITDSRNVF